MVREAKRGIGAAGVPEGTEVVDCKGKVVAPGLIDIRAFIGEPGAEYRETFASASQAAAAGGVTTIVCQPDTNPAIDDPAIVDFVMRRARDTAIVRVHPMAALTKGLKGQEMTEIGLLKAAGAVAFTDGDQERHQRPGAAPRADLCARLRRADRPPHRGSRSVGDGVMNEGELSARLGLIGMPTAAEAIMLERDMRLVALTAGRYHAASLTCRESLDVLRRAKEAGLSVTASASINHLTLNEVDVGSYRTFCKLTPPLRAEADRAALVQALVDGLIDVVMSDHNPQDVETKRLPFADAAPGAIGIETMLPAGLRLVHIGRNRARRAVEGDVDAAGARCSACQAARCKPGSVADVIVIDPDVPWVLDRDDLKSKCKNTPFDEASCRAASCAPSSPAAPSTNTCNSTAARFAGGQAPAPSSIRRAIFCEA